MPCDGDDNDDEYTNTSPSSLLHAVSIHIFLTFHLLLLPSLYPYHLSGVCVWQALYLSAITVMSLL